MPNNQRVLYIIVCAAPPAGQVHELVELATANGWTVCVILTPQATRFVDRPKLAQLTKYPVRVEYKLPGEADPLPQPDVIAVVPATFNTINKWAQGIGDTLAASMLCEHLGRGTPTVAVPCLKQDLAKHPAFSRNLHLLTKWGVRMLYEPDRFVAPKILPWHQILDAVIKAVKPLPSGSKFAVKARMTEHSNPTKKQGQARRTTKQSEV